MNFISFVSSQFASIRLEISYSIETETRSNAELDRLLRSIDLYSIHRLPLQMTISTEDRAMFLEQSCAPLTRFTMKQIFERLDQESNVDLHQVSNEFYHHEIENLFRELLDGSTRLNRSFLVQKLKEKFHNQKDSVEKLYRLMIKENLIDSNLKQKRNNEKKKIAAMISRVNELFQSNIDEGQQRKFVELLKKIDLSVNFSHFSCRLNDAISVEKNYSRIDRTLVQTRSHNFHNDSIVTERSKTNKSQEIVRSKERKSC